MKKILLFCFAVLSFETAFSQPSIWGGAYVKLQQGDTTYMTTLGAVKTWLGLSGGGTVSSFSAGNLSPLFTTSVSNPTTTPALSFTLSNFAANTYYGNATGSSAAPSATAAGALTKTDDTNVTLTLGGSPSTALLTSASLTLGWTGTLAVARGGLGVGTVTGLLQGNGTSAVTAITNSSTVGQVLRVTGSSTYAWGALDLADADAVTGTLPIGNGSTGLTAVGSDVTLLGSNGSANIYYTLARTNNSAAIGWSRSSTTLNFNLPDADASFPGIVNTGTQTFAGAKTFSGAATVQGLLTGSAGIAGTATSTVAAVNVKGVEDGDFRTVTTTSTLSETDNVIYVGTLSADITLNLPACNSDRDGWIYHVMKKGSDAFAYILDPAGAETFFDGAPTKTYFGQGMTAHCKCENGLGWNILR